MLSPATTLLIDINKSLLNENYVGIFMMSTRSVVAGLVVFLPFYFDIFNALE
jgi:hypothetical protein